MTSDGRKAVTVEEMLNDPRYGLGLSVLAGHSGLQRTLEYPRVQKSGLALAGFLESVRPHRLQVFGKTELKYLDSLSPERATAAIDSFFASDVAAVVVTADQAIQPYVTRAANAHAIPVLRSTNDSSRFINQVQELLDERLSPEQTVHGVMMDVFGIGVLLLGASGIGKSECALDLVLRGQRLIADDAVRLVRRRNDVVASSLELTKHHMEIRGLGVINVMDMYGAAAVRDQSRLELVVEMLGDDASREIDRLGLDEYSTSILGIEIAKVTIPIRPGRNVSSIVEVAARNHLLKMQGHHAAQTLSDRVDNHLAAQSRESQDRT